MSERNRRDVLGGLADMTLPPQGPPTWEAAHRFGASGLMPPPARSEADAYRMGGMANMDEYRQAPATAWRDIDRQAIEDQYGGTDIHGIKLPPVSADEPKAWRDAIIGETPADALVNWGLGGTGRAAKAALALGGLFKLTDPAEAGVLGKAGGLLRGKAGGPWEGGIRAYHSSPHDFDRFDWSKLRTGEGANTYGAGFYFAENPAVSGQGGQYWNQFSKRFTGDERTASTYLQAGQFDRERAAENLHRSIYDTKQAITNGKHSNGQVMSPEYITDQIEYMNQQRRALKLLESGASVGPRTYEVNIAARPELMLDWDKPLSQNPVAVKDAFARMGYDPNAMSGQMGSEAYRSLGIRYHQPNRGHLDDVIASEKLADAGIPGIRYLDQGSRNAPISSMGIKQLEGRLEQYKADLAGGLGDPERMKYNIASIERELASYKPTYNYVVTDPSKLDILAKYGVVGTAGGMGALAAQDRYGGAP